MVSLQEFVLSSVFVIMPICICNILPLYLIRSKLFHFASECCGRSRGICSSAEIPFLVISVLDEIRGLWRIWSCPHRIIITVWPLTLRCVIWLELAYVWNFRSVPSRQLLKQASHRASACYIRLDSVMRLLWGFPEVVFKLKRSLITERFYNPSERADFNYNSTKLLRCKKIKEVM